MNIEWKKYPENKPEKMDFYICTLSSPHDTWVEIVCYLKDSWQLPGRGDTLYVTHWMPIPKPAQTCFCGKEMKQHAKNYHYCDCGKTRMTNDK